MPTPFRLTYALAPSRRKVARVTLAMGGGLFAGDQEKEMSRQVLDIMLRCLTEIDVLYLRAHPETPRLYESGVFYREEPPGQEDWQDIPTSLFMGWLDCEDCACWLAAERIVRDGIQARATWKAFPREGGGTLYHIVVVHPNGYEEDPSKILGMR